LKLAVALVSKGRYYLAGEEVPDDLLPPKFVKYVATNDTDDQAQRRSHKKPHKRKTRSPAATSLATSTSQARDRVPENNDVHDQRAWLDW
jgi:hypothetical protein